MLRRDGLDVAGMYSLSPEMLERGVPPHWLSYVSVDDFVATATRVSELGGTVGLGPVRGHGRRRHGGDPRPPRSDACAWSRAATWARAW